MHTAEAVSYGRHPSGTAAGDSPLAQVALVLLGAVLGASQLWHGFYDETTWEPIALATVALLLAFAIGAPRRPALLALGPLLGLWLWSLISSGWSESTDNSHVAAARWLLYAVTFALLSWAIVDSRRRAIAVLAGAAGAIVAVGAWMLVRMLDGHGAALFLSTRLNDPLGYVNGQGGYLLVGVWPCLALAEARGSSRSGAFAGAGVAAIVGLLGLGLLTQSRSWGIASIVCTLLLLVVVPGRQRRMAAVLLLAVAIAAIYAPLSAVWRQPSRLGAPTSSATQHAAVAIIVAALAAGVVWGVTVASLEEWAPADSRARSRAAATTSLASVALGIALLVVLGVNASSISHRVRVQYEAFVHLSPSPGSTRLLSGAGNRYDYWRVAVAEFRSAPVIGVGAGNYQPGYYIHRHTTESITQPHSIELQTLAELGIIGALLLAMFLAAVAIGARRTAVAARASPLARFTAVSATGIFSGWLLQTSVDWLHLFPGLTAIALAAAVALLARPDARATTLGRGSKLVAIAVAGVLAIAGTVTIAPRLLSVHSSDAAQQALIQRRPAQAITKATRALDYDPSSVEALVLRAAGFARLGAFKPALTDLRTAIAVEPDTWTTWALLGDLFTRRGDRAAARKAYGHARALNPLEPGL